MNRVTATQILKKNWKEISRLDEKIVRGEANEAEIITQAHLKADCVRIMELVTTFEELQPETEEEYADRKFDEEVAFLTKHGNLKST